jgi:hypothetical protein
MFAFDPFAETGIRSELDKIGITGGVGGCGRECVGFESGTVGVADAAPAFCFSGLVAPVSMVRIGKMGTL